MSGKIKKIMPDEEEEVLKDFGPDLDEEIDPIEALDLGIEEEEEDNML